MSDYLAKHIFNQIKLGWFKPWYTHPHFHNLSSVSYRLVSMYSHLVYNSQQQCHLCRTSPHLSPRCKVSAIYRPRRYLIAAGRPPSDRYIRSQTLGNLNYLKQLTSRLLRRQEGLETGIWCNPCKSWDSTLELPGIRSGVLLCNFPLSRSTVVLSGCYQTCCPFWTLTAGRTPGCSQTFYQVWLLSSLWVTMM